MPYRQTDRTRRHAAEKQVAFLRAAHDLVAEHGFAGARVSAIARACRSSTGSLYSYFDSRDELLAAVFRAAADRELTAVRRAVAAAAGAPARLDALIGSFTGRALRGRRLAWSLLFEPVSPVVEAERLVYRRAYRELGEEIVTAGIAEGSFVPQHATVAASAAIGAISEALVGRLAPADGEQDPGPPDELLVAEIRDFCFRALLTPGAEAPHPGAPGSEAPGSEAPGSQAPGSQAPGSGAPGSGAPGSGAPDAEAPRSGAPDAEAPRSGAPERSPRPR